MFEEIRNKIDNTGIDVLVGIPDWLALIILFIGYQLDIKETKADNLFIISIVTFLFGSGFMFAIIKKEYPIYFKTRIKGRSAVILGIIGVSLTWLTTLWSLIEAMKYLFY